MGPRSGDKAIPEAECTVPGASDGGVQARDERPGPLLCSPRKSWQGTREEQRVRAGEADGWAGRRPQLGAGCRSTGHRPGGEDKRYTGRSANTFSLTVWARDFFFFFKELRGKMNYLRVDQTR